MLNRPAFPYILLFIVGLFTHGLLILNQGNFGDGWAMEYFFKTGNGAEVQGLWTAKGSPWVYWVYKAFWSPIKYVHNSFIFLSIFTISSTLFFFLSNFTPMKRIYIYFVTLVVLTWPFYPVAVTTGQTPVFLWGSLFFLGWTLYFYIQEQKRFLILKYLSVFMIFASFTYNSLLVCHYIFIGILFCRINNSWGEKLFTNVSERVRLIIKRHWVMPIMPFIFYLLKSFLFRKSGVEEIYNKITFSFRSIEVFVKFVIHSLFDPFEALFVVGAQVWFILIPLVLLSGFFFWKTRSLEFFAEKEKNHVWLMCVGLGIICVAAFPYSAVGKYPDIFSVRARHGYFGAAGFGMFMLGLVGQLLKNKEKSTLKWGSYILCQIIICFVVINIGLYASWQGRWAKYQSISANLTQMVPLENTNIYFLRDESPTILKPKYEYNDFTLIINNAWGGEKVLGVTPFFQRNRPESVVAQEAIRIWHTKRWQGNVAARNFKSEGCVGEVVVKPKFEKNEIETGFLYLYYKLFQPDKLDSFVLNLITVDMRSLDLDSRGKICT